MTEPTDWQSSGPPATDRADGSSRPRLRARFDPTINLGHILTALVTIATAFSAGIAAWNSLDRRISTVEIRIDGDLKVQAQRDANQDLLLRESIVSIKESIQRIERDIKEARK